MIAFPVTSACPLSCVFCSHNGNPFDLKVEEINSYDSDQILKKASLIKNREIVIGESATRVIEGEPFLFKDIMRLIDILAENNNSISITTSGVFLDEKIIKRLSEIPKLEMNISVNSIDPEFRKKYLGDRISKDFRNILHLLDLFDVSYTSSVVALKINNGFDDLIKTIEFLGKSKSILNRIFIPGFTNINRNPIFDFDITILEKTLRKIREEKVPIIIEPGPIEKDIKVQAILKSSVADENDIKFDDVILSLNDKSDLTSKDVHELLKVNGRHKIKIKRGKSIIKKELNIKNNRSGIILKDSPSMELMKKISSITKEDDIIICSRFSEDFFKGMFPFKKVLSVSCDRFGGNISCNGLLSVGDINSILRKGQCESIVIDPSFLNNDGIDLFGQDIYSITYEKDINIKLLY
ncbi:MAG: hypothetical protein C0601_10880 [Candidatus Muiribacterium halophilum]|uniref:Radical SAM core domain-containing protein n=1 Tax=Muiribacterium halophilum TaxID=2053465 RepID=A0A2N5ZBT9_MUIH1|nr:MAG: hypothetical protein C0601_10880 [Candidatus Muirbacterium halophilum]